MLEAKRRLAFSIQIFTKFWRGLTQKAFCLATTHLSFRYKQNEDGALFRFVHSVHMLARFVAQFLVPRVKMQELFPADALQVPRLVQHVTLCPGHPSSLSSGKTPRPAGWPERFCACGRIKVLCASARGWRHGQTLLCKPRTLTLLEQDHLCYALD